MKKLLLMTSLMILAMAFMATSAMSTEFDLGGGKTVHVLGSLSNQFQVSMVNDEYDTEEGLQQWLMSLQLSAGFDLSQNLKAYISGIATVDWIYAVKHNDSSWNGKDFNRSRKNLYFDDEWWQLLSEAHVTWTPGDFLFRVGKQIAKWGEMELTTVLDTINPRDARRGLGDVEFETATIAIPMVRAEYFPPIYTDAFSSPTIQLLFIPNGDYIPSIPPFGAYLGNDTGGIYSTSWIFDTGLGFNGRTGSADYDIDESIDPEIAIKFSAQIYGSILSIMGLYGYENSPVLSTDYTKPGFGGMYMGISARTNPFSTDDEGNPIIHPLYHGYHAKERFVGLSWASEIPFMRYTLLGGVVPLFRIEARYDFDKTLANENWIYGLGTEYEKTDVRSYGLSLEQKIRIRNLQKSYWSFSFEYTNTKLEDYEPGWAVTWLSPGNRAETFGFYFFTSYFNAKLVPSLWYQRDITNRGNGYWPGLQYIWSNNLDFYLGAGIFSGQAASDWYGIDNKDFYVFKINYKF